MKAIAIQLQFVLIFAPIIYIEVIPIWEKKKKKKNYAVVLWYVWRRYF